MGAIATARSRIQALGILGRKRAGPKQAAGLGLGMEFMDRCVFEVFDEG